METMVAEKAFKQALEEGAEAGVLAALQQVADAGAKIDFGEEQLSPLAYCILNGRENLAALLLDKNAPFCEHEAEAYCEVLRGAGNPQDTIPMLQLLLEKRRSAPATGLYRRLADGSICLRPMLFEIARYGTVQHLELLCRAGADLSLPDQDGVNVLMYAFWGDEERTDTEKIEFIEQQNLHLWHKSTRNKKRNLYAYAHDETAISILLKHGVDYNHVDADGLTPLVWAAKRQNAAGAELLMRAGALVAPKEASEKERERLFRLFLGLHRRSMRRSRFGRKPIYPERNLNKELLSLLLAQTLCPEERRRVCDLALAAACVQKHRELVDYCLSEGADINIHTDGLSLLGLGLAQSERRWVSHKRNGLEAEELIAYLLEKGADPNCRAFGVQPVLQTALVLGASPEVVKLLLAHGAERNQAIPYAVSDGQTKPEILALLVDRGSVDKDLLYKSFLGGRTVVGNMAALRSKKWIRLRELGLIEMTEDDTDALGNPLTSLLKRKRISDPSFGAESSGNKGNSPALRWTAEIETILLSPEEYEAVEQHIPSGNADFIREMLKKYPRFATSELRILGNTRRYPACYALGEAAAAAQPELCRILVEAISPDESSARQVFLHHVLRDLLSAVDCPAKTESLKILLEYARNQQIDVDRCLYDRFGGSWSDAQVLLFLEYGAETLAAAHEGATFLHRALADGVYPLVQRLVRLGCSLETCSGNGYTCLHWACCGGDADCVRLCIEAGADVRRAVETPQGDSVTPMSLYCENAVKMSADILELFLQRGVSVDWQDASGMPLLMLAIETAQSAELVKMLLQHGADVHCRIETPQGDKITPMSLYWENGREKSVETLELLLNYGASVDWSDCCGMTLLMHAIRTAHSAEMVKMLLQHGADVHLRDREGNTPLMLAVLEQEEEICRLLMEAGSSPGDRNNAGCTAMDFARLMQEEPESEK